ncbi:MULTISPECIES: K(+)-transporting ATPase subunit F [unclassified Marinobacter]
MEVRTHRRRLSVSIFLLLVSVAVGGYLVAALLRPERF